MYNYHTHTHTHRWAALEALATDRRETLTAALEKATHFNDDWKKLVAWLSDMESKVFTEWKPCALPETCAADFTKHQVSLCLYLCCHHGFSSFSPPPSIHLSLSPPSITPSLPSLHQQVLAAEMEAHSGDVEALQLAGEEVKDQGTPEEQRMVDRWVSDVSQRWEGLKLELEEKQVSPPPLG